MIVSYLRSSSYGTWSFCQMQYWLTYVLGLKSGQEGFVRPKSEFKSDQGNQTHKALELLGHKKLAIQNGEATFAEGEIGKTWNVADFTNDDAFVESWDHYARIAPHWDWNDPAILAKIRPWFDDVLKMNSGMWNPMNRDIVAPEAYFDYTIDEPWASYKFTSPDGEAIEGQLGIKGTVDMVTRVNDKTYELLDWKTGQRKDWATGKVKDWPALRDDFQLRLYHYALTRLYPEIDHFMVTIVFIANGGPFTLDFGPEDIPDTLAMIRSRFEDICRTQAPVRIIHDAVHSWKCKMLCTFGMSKQPETNITVCEHMNREIVQLGLAKVTEKYDGFSRVTKYGSGGGVVNRDAKKESKDAE